MCTTAGILYRLFSIYHFRILLCSPEGHLGSWPSLRQQKLLVLLLQHFSMGDLRKHHQQYIFTLKNSFSSLEGKSPLDSQQLLPNMFLLSLERQRKAAYLSKHQKFAKCQQCTLLRPQSEFFNFEVRVKIPITRMNFIMHGALMLSFQKGPIILPYHQTYATLCCRLFAIPVTIILYLPSSHTRTLLAYIEPTIFSCTI